MRSQVSFEVWKRAAKSDFDLNRLGDKLVAQAEGSFLYVTHSVRGIERGLIELGSVDTIPPGLKGLFVRQFEQQFSSRDSYQMAKRQLGVIYVSVRQLSET